MRVRKKVHVYPLVLLLVVVLALAGPVTGGGMKATFASGGGAGSRSGDAAALLRHVMSTRLEDVVAPELTVDLDLHRRVLAGGDNIRHKALDPNAIGCFDPCGGRGQQYTGRGCEKPYGCHGRT